MGSWIGLPVAASAHAWQIDQLIVITHIVMGVAFVGWGLFFLIPLLRFRKGKHPKAIYAGLKTHMPYVFVALMAVAEMVLLLGISLPFWEDEVAAAPKPGDDVFEVVVVAQQFQWNIHYPGPDAIFGKRDIAHMDAQLNPLGLDSNDANGYDDVAKLNQLHVPVDTKVLIHLSTKDVVHSFFLPELRVKQDALPGMTVPVYFVPTMTTQDFKRLTRNAERDFEIACAQLCGLTHYTMRGILTVETREEFDAWYAEQLDAKRQAEEDEDWF